MILDKEFPPDPRVENEAITLVKAGHDVHLFCLDYAHDQKTREMVKGIHVYRQRLPSYIYQFSALAYTIPYYHHVLNKWIKKFILSVKPDALHVHDMQIARSVFNANKPFNLPITLDLHENRPEIMRYYGHVNSLWGKALISIDAWKKFEYKYIKKADHVITVTDEAADYYVDEISVNPDKFYTVPNTVRKDWYNIFTKHQDIINKYKNNFTLLYLGDTGVRRGLKTVLESLKYLVPKIHNIKIVLVGASKQDHILKTYVKEHAFEEYVDFEGWTDFDLFQSYVLASEVGLCPIHRNLHHDTTYANKLFQCMAFGKPIVVSDCLAQKNLVEKYDCGRVFEDQNVTDFANKIIEIYENKSTYQQLSNNSREAIEDHLNWEVMSKQLLKIYENERDIIREHL